MTSMTTQDGWQQADIEISVENVLPVLATNLYGDDPGCAIREALQNAHDACIDREVAGEDAFNITIDVFIDRESSPQCLVIRDSGIGMSMQDVTEKLARIGATTKTDVQEIKTADTAQQRALAEERIGRFGLGFLAAFIIANRVELKTRRFDAPQHEGTEARFDGQTQYQFRQATVPLCGTELRLYLKEQFFPPGSSKREVGSNLTDSETLKRIIRQYADLVRYPIKLHRDMDMNAERVTINIPPWETPSVETDYEEFYAHRFPDTNKPLAIFPVRIDKEIQLGDRPTRLKAGGLLYIPNPPANKHQNYGVIDLYVKRMFVCQDRDSLLPEWATHFCNGVIDSPSLTETLDRNNVVRTDAMYIELSKELGRTLIEAMKKMETEGRENFALLINRHARRIREAALNSPESSSRFLESVGPSLPVMVWSQEFPMGETMSLRDYLERHARPNPQAPDVKRITYFFHTSRSMLQDLVGQEKIAVIDVAEEVEEAFLKAYAATADKVELFNIAENLGDFVKAVSHADAEPWKPFLTYFQGLHQDESVIAQVREFRPSEVPAILVQIPRSEDDEEILKEALDQLAGSPVGDAVREKLERRGTRDTDLKLFINAGNRLMRDLLKHQEESGSQTLLIDVELALHEIFHNARVYAAIPNTPQMNQHIFEYHSKVLQRMLELLQSEERGNRRTNELEQKLTTAEKDSTDLRDKLTRTVKNMRDIGQGNKLPDDVGEIFPD